MTIPARPSQFTHEGAPVGVEVKFFSQWRNRPLLDHPARILAYHTNAARGEGSVESASAWAERNVSDPANSYTIPHYQVDRSGRARKILPTNRRGIANSTVLPGSSQWSSLTNAERAKVSEHPVNVSRFSIAIETADTGTDADPAISAFTNAQIERLAEITAYEHLVAGNAVPLATPSQWYGSGIGAHTAPFPYPFWTTKRGKICPGSKKKAQVAQIIARARQIAAAWGGTPPPPNPPGDDDVNWNPTNATVAAVTQAPATADVLAGKVNDWAVISAIKAMQVARGLPVTGRWSQALGNEINELI